MPNTLDLRETDPMPAPSQPSDTLGERVAALTSKNAELQRLLLELGNACEECCLERCRKPTARPNAYPCRPATLLAGAGFTSPPVPPEDRRDDDTTL